MIRASRDPTSLDILAPEVGDGPRPATARARWSRSGNPSSWVTAFAQVTIVEGALFSARRWRPNEARLAGSSGSAVESTRGATSCR